jgi:hypothetical protein
MGQRKEQRNHPGGLHAHTQANQASRTEQTHCAGAGNHQHARCLSCIVKHRFGVAWKHSLCQHVTGAYAMTRKPRPSCLQSQNRSNHQARLVSDVRLMPLCRGTRHPSKRSRRLDTIIAMLTTAPSKAVHHHRCRSYTHPFRIVPMQCIIIYRNSRQDKLQAAITLP